VRPDHRFLRAADVLGPTGRQWLDVAPVLVGAVVVLIGGDLWPVPLAWCAASVLFVLTDVLFARVQRERDSGIALILERREGLFIALIQRERKRLLAQRTRARLVDEFEDELRLVRRPRRSVSVAPARFESSVLGPLKTEVHGVIGLLGAGGCSARAVVCPERLVGVGSSRFYEREVDARRGELRRLLDRLKERELR
jgi:hypothetical protein